MDLRESVELALKRRLPGLQTSWGGEGGGTWLETPPACIPEVGAALRDDPATAFDFLACMSGVDRHPLEPRFEVVYHLRSLKLNRLLVVKTRVSEKAASVPTLTDVWRTADWFEREIYDLLGVTFSGHPDLRRILLPEDWDGYPLRKDYPLEGLHPGPGLSAEEG